MTRPVTPSWRFPRVLLVTPFSPGRYFGGVRPPVGVGYLDEHLRHMGIETFGLDMCTGYGERDLLRKIESTRPALIGFSVMTYQFEHTFQMIERVKRRFPEIPIIAGGPHASALEGDVLNGCPAIDFVVAGEGEATLGELCLGAPVESLPGLFYREGGAVRQGAPRRYLEDLDQLPFPRFSNYPLEQYVGEVEIITSRGCPHTCIFCAVANIMGRQVRFRSAEHVLEELDYFYRRGIRAIQIGDDNFLADRPRVMALLEAIQSRGYPGLVFRCGQGIRADLLDREILTEMWKAGFRHLGIGVESASDRVLRVVQKHATVDRIDASVGLACELGFDVSLFFVIGVPTETSADIDKSIAFARKYPVMKAFFFNLIPLPGTSLFKWASENQWMLGSYEELVNRPDEFKLRSRPFFATPEFPESERLEAIRRTDRVSKDIRVATLRRKFQRLGILAPLLAEVGRYEVMERLFIRCRVLRSLLNRLLFGMPRRKGGA